MRRTANDGTIRAAIVTGSTSAPVPSYCSRNGLSEFLSLETTFDHDYLEQPSASLGLRREF